jgi:hypothetical protein
MSIVFIIFLVITVFILNVLIGVLGYVSTPSALLNTIYSDVNQLLAAVIAASIAGRFILKRAVIQNDKIDTLSAKIALSPIIVSFGIVLVVCVIGLLLYGSIFIGVAQTRLPEFFVPSKLFETVIMWVLMFGVIYLTLKQTFKRGLATTK